MISIFEPPGWAQAPCPSFLWMVDTKQKAQTLLPVNPAKDQRPQTPARQFILWHCRACLMGAGVNIVPSGQPARAWPASIPLPACSSHATWFHHLELNRTLGSVLKGSGSRVSLHFYDFLPAALALWAPSLSISSFMRSVTKCYRNISAFNSEKIKPVNIKRSQP